MYPLVKQYLFFRPINGEKRTKNNEKIIGYGSPAKATTSLNFYGVSSDIDFIVEDNKYKHGKYIPGVKIPIVKKDNVIDKSNTMIVLACNFFEDIKNNNSDLYWVHRTP